jgi:hypothetical protein
MSEEPRLDTQLKLVKPRIAAYNADGTRKMIDLKTVRFLRELGSIARMVQRRKDQAVSRISLKAEPNQIATRITAAPTVTRVLPMTYTHTSSLMAGY